MIVKGDFARLEEILDRIMEPVDMQGDFRKDLFRRLIEEHREEQARQNWQYALLGGLVLATGVGGTVAVARAARGWRKRRHAMLEEKAATPAQATAVPAHHG